MSHTDLTPCTRVLASSGTVPIAEELLARVLEPYSCKGCRYLIDAQYSATEDSVLAYGNFTIGESAYIRSTGHFNAVELILCFNQLAYSAFAPAVLNEEIRVLRGWSIDDYCQHQLSSMLIRKASSRFRKPLNPQSSLPASCVEICRSSNEPGAISRSRASSSSGTRTAGRRPVRSN